MDKNLIGKCSHCDKDVFYGDDYRYCGLYKCEGRKNKQNTSWNEPRPIMCFDCRKKNNHICKPCLGVLEECLTCKEQLLKTEFDRLDSGSFFVDSCKRCVHFRDCGRYINKFTCDDCMHYVFDRLEKISEKNNYQDLELKNILGKMRDNKKRMKRYT